MSKSKVCKIQGGPKAKPSLGTLGILHANTAGIDIGSREIWVAVSPNRAGEMVRYFGTFTSDLHVLADWLVENQIDTVAIESTGVYCIPLFELLEAQGLRIFLVNAHYIKHVPGRKSDVLDCQWLQKLHSLDLLTGSFRPDAEMVILRTYLRHRSELIQRRAPHTRSIHMQKALQPMNLQLHHGIFSMIWGKRK